MSRLVDVEPLEKYLAGLINLARRDEVGIRFPSVDAWKAELEHLKELPTITPTQRWISVKDSQPEKDGIYFAVYKFWHWDDCVSTREFKDGKWTEENNRGKVRLWMPIPKIVNDEDGGE
jgi:hypothetical protein